MSDERLNILTTVFFAFILIGLISLILININGKFEPISFTFNLSSIFGVLSLRNQ